VFFFFPDFGTSILLLGVKVIKQTYLSIMKYRVMRWVGRVV